MIVLYVLDGCPYCRNAIKILKDNNIEHSVINVRNEEKEYYKNHNKMNTFPQIFIQSDKNYYLKIGGYSELTEIINNCNNIKESFISFDLISLMYKNMYSK